MTRPPGELEDAGQTVAQINLASNGERLDAFTQLCEFCQLIKANGEYIDPYLSFSTPNQPDYWFCQGPPKIKLSWYDTHLHIPAFAFHPRHPGTPDEHGWEDGVQIFNQLDIDLWSSNHYHKWLRQNLDLPVMEDTHEEYQYQISHVISDSSTSGMSQHTYKQDSWSSPAHVHFSKANLVATVLNDRQIFYQ